MTDPDSGIHNTTESGGTSGIQAEQVHNSTVYQVLPGDPPHKTYEVGVRYLEHGIPSRARELIGDVLAQHYDNAEVQVHRVLALLSERSLGDLTHEEHGRLRVISESAQTYPLDEWRRALEVICAVLQHPDDGAVDVDAVLDQLDELKPPQRDKIVRHLAHVLDGRVKDQLWNDTRDEARADQLSGDRRNRVWAYFQPTPAQPRVRYPAADTSTLADRGAAGVASAGFLAALGYLGWLVLDQPSLLSTISYLCVITAVVIGSWHGITWYCRISLSNAWDRAYLAGKRPIRSSDLGFAKKVDDLFEYYFKKYHPADPGRDDWINVTSGVRGMLRDELIDVYRESTVNSGNIKWLIRFLARATKSSWEEGTFFGHREQYRVTPAMKVWCCGSLTVLLPATVGTLAGAMQQRPFIAPIATLAALAAGRVAAMRWLHILSERHRCAEERRDREHALEQRWAEYRRWATRLASLCPTEDEMEGWLRCDKTMLLDETLQHYRLHWDDIIAHTFLQTHAAKYKRARERNGPWRYSRYEIQLFLITQYGVREVSRDLDFEQG